MSDENEESSLIASLIRTVESNWRLILVGIIIIAIAITSSNSDNKSSEENKTTITPQAEQTGQANETPANNAPQTENTKTAENSTNVAQAKEPEANNTSGSDGNTIVQTAQKSEGVTHLARKALKEYLGNNNETLSAEQKIYVEDYLKRQIGSKKLAVGEKIEFGTNSIKQGIEKAKGLGENQIKNLSKYVPLVKNLN